MGFYYVIDLYSKFLIAFIGIVTPALTLFLNNYIIDRTNFTAVIKKTKIFAGNLIKQQTKEMEAAGKSDSDLYEVSNKLLKETNQKLEKWEEVDRRLNPKKFFKKNLSLLIGSLFFLFVLLFIRSEEFINYKTYNFQRCQLTAWLLSVGLCGIHIFNLITMGIYVINERETVFEINEAIKEEKDKAKSKVGEAPMGGKAKNKPFVKKK